LQQYRLSLVILMMGRQQNGGACLRAQRFERSIPGFARRFFNALPRINLYVDATRMKRHAGGLGHTLTGTFPHIGIGLQAVVNMQGNELHTGARIPPRSTRVQERGGIPPARQCNRHGRCFDLARNNKGRTRGNALCDLVDEISRRISDLRFP